MERAGWSTATVRTASGTAPRMATSRANVNDIFAHFCPSAILAKDSHLATVKEEAANLAAALERGGNMTPLLDANQVRSRRIAVSSIHRPGRTLRR